MCLRRCETASHYYWKCQRLWWRSCQGRRGHKLGRVTFIFMGGFFHHHSFFCLFVGFYLKVLNVSVKDRMQRTNKEELKSLRYCILYYFKMCLHMSSSVVLTGK